MGRVGARLHGHIFSNGEVGDLMQAIVGTAPPGVHVMMRYPFDREACPLPLAAASASTTTTSRPDTGSPKSCPDGSAPTCVQNFDFYNPYNPNKSARTNFQTIG